MPKSCRSWTRSGGMAIAVTAGAALLGCGTTGRIGHDAALPGPAPTVAAPLHEVIASDHAPAAIGPYSQAIRVGDWLFCSGQIPLDPATGELVTGPIEVQTRRALDNLGAVLEAAGLGFEDVVKVTVFLRDLEDYAAMNAVYAEYFAGAKPARAAVQVARLPRNVGVEVECIAHGGR
jgi:2-iminobutanoate/2-iminopropanoate deaminase